MYRSGYGTEFGKTNPCSCTSPMLLSGHFAWPFTCETVSRYPLVVCLTNICDWVNQLLCIEENSTSWLWLFTLIASSCCCIWLYGSIRMPREPPASFQSLPERELTLELKIERSFRNAVHEDFVSGIASISHTPDIRADLAGKAIYFRLRIHKASTQFCLKDSIILARGILSPCPVTKTRKDFYHFLRQQNVFYRLQRGQVLEIRKGPSDLNQMLAKLHFQFLQTLRLGIPKEAPAWGIYPAILLGYKSELSPQLKNYFQRSGTLHLFAISGLHIGIVAAIIIQALSLIRIPRIYTGCCGLCLTFLFVLITGSSPSAVRAFAMIAFYWLCLCIGRQRSALAAWTASALILLIIDPQQLWNVGFQLSYSVVFSILLLGLPLHHFLLRKLAPNQAIPLDSLALWQRCHQMLFEKFSLL